MKSAVFMALLAAAAAFMRPKSIRCGLPRMTSMKMLQESSPMDFASMMMADESVTTSITSGESTYSGLSLYFTLFLYVLSLPGLYSLITRSVKVKPVERIYDLPGPANPTARSLRQTAGEVMAYFKANNYQVTTAEDVITFKGIYILLLPYALSDLLTF